MVIFITLAILFQIAYGNSATYQDYERLVNDVITPYHYRSRPMANQSKAVEVEVTFNFLNLIEVNEVQHQIQLNGWFNFTWQDELRIWNASDYGEISVIHPGPREIWLPRVAISNSLLKRDMFEDDYSSTTIYSNGLSRWYPGAVLFVSCDLDMTYFPFDTQDCDLSILTMDYIEATELKSSVLGIAIFSYQENGEWIFVSHHTTAERVAITGETFSRLRFHFRFERRSLFYVINILIPTMFLSLLTFFAFIIPEDSGERSSFAITCLLSLAVYMTIISSLIPSTSNTFPIIINYIFGLLLTSGLSVMIMVVQYRFKVERAKSKVEGKGADSGETRDETKFGLPTFHSSTSSLNVGNPASDSTTMDNAESKLGKILQTSMPRERNVSKIHFDTMKVKVHPSKEEEAKSSNNPKSQMGKAVSFILKNNDVQFFLFFVMVWIFLLLYFLGEMASN